MAKSESIVAQTVQLTKVFKDFWMRSRVTAIDSLDLDVRAHEIFGLLGPNGSGKSTTIKILLGLLYPTKGRVSVFGKLPTDVAAKSRIGYLPEESYLYRFLNARETLDYYGRLFHQARRERNRRIEMLLDMVGLTAVQRRPVGEYSKGMQRRIGLAQALINDPDLLILDEPTTGLDPIGTRQIKDLIIELGRRGKTVLLSSHLLADVEDVCDRACVLYGGVSRALGTVDQLLAQEDRTQIETELLAPETIEKIKKLILDEEQKQVLDVRPPRHRLEAFFLKIVREAQQENLQTSGAVSGGKIAEFLTTAGAEGEELIEELVNAAEPEPAPAKAPEPAAPAEQVREDVLEDLVKPADPAELGPTIEEPPAAVDKRPREQTDRSIIDELTSE